MQYQCYCGTRLSNVLVPNDIQLRVYTDFEWEEVLNNDLVEDIPLPKYDVWCCTNCKRIIFFDGLKVEMVYKLEYDECTEIIRRVELTDFYSSITVKSDAIVMAL
ncbi:hypothetical protein DFP97_106314 [Paenibacillus prosopidis]|uniref:Uncharacterized protein n=1 Tax=Paenibacillus prosopidis TaxID=630520 RepID=A0A368W1A0_9BACL|nr:hypothetical protein DFP97_106314 [Paenibacillus prosopidis]